MALPETDLAEIANWAAARRSVRVTLNLLQDDPDNVALKTRLAQQQETAEQADFTVRRLVRQHGLTQATLQEHLRGA